MPPNTADIPVGIDLGTTYSLLAYLDDAGRPLSLPNSSGEILTPSAVIVDQDTVLVGKEAVKGMVLSPEDYIDGFKRDMGRPTAHRALRGAAVPPEVLSALVLERLKHDAQRHLGLLHKAVITVPAYFDELRRKATQDAGRLAGWDVLDIINEPTAAALACGFERGPLGPGDPPGKNRSRRVLVYDLGGGTFDVSLLEIDGTTFRTMATDGDVQLGGKDFDQRLVDHLAGKFAAAHGVDPRSDLRTAAQLWRDAQEAKHALSERSRTSVICVHAAIRMKTDVTRAEFEHLTQDLLERTRHTADDVVRRARLDWSRIDRVLLVGGSTRMPMVSRMLRELSGKKPDVSLSPDQAVAHGAARYAGMLLGHRGAGGKRACRLINVNSHSLGVVGIDEQIRQRVNAVLIPRNTPIPARQSRRFHTLKEGQRAVAVPVVEGESDDPEFCVALGQCVVSGLPPGLPRGTPVEVTYCYLPNGRLDVSARVPSTGQAAEVRIERTHRIIEHDLETWKQHLLGKTRIAVAPRPTTRAVTDEAVDLGDRSSVVRRLDTLYIRVGQLARTAAVPDGLIASQRVALEAGLQWEHARRDVAEARRRHQQAAGAAEAIRLGARLSQAKSAEEQAANQSAFAHLAFGRECYRAGFSPAGCERDFEEIRRLRNHLERDP